MYNPVSTYRFQLNKDFTLNNVAELLPYLQQLGVTTIYGSPIYVATPGSSHGYDAVDPTRINPEIGTEEQLRTLSERLKQAGMGWFQDIVPNHMAYHPNNEWLMDILEKGPISTYAEYFETSLSSSFFRGRIEAPFLPEDLEHTIANGDLTLDYADDRLVFHVQGNTLPLKPNSYATVLRAGETEPNQALNQLLDQLEQLRQVDEPEAYVAAWSEFKTQLAALVHHSATARYIQSAIAHVNQSPTLLHTLAEEQFYRFRTEPKTRQEMNYRRFFTVNGLICLNMREQEVFDAYHAFTKKLVDEGVFQGLRVDHVDGLYDPKQYLERLRALTGSETWLIVEKILQADEDLPTDWPINGASGYEFLAHLNNLLTNADSEPAFRQFYAQLVGNETPIHQQIRDRKAYFLAQYMGGELDNLYQYFRKLKLVDETELADLTEAELKHTIGAVLVHCPVYRYYGNQLPLSETEADAFRAILAEATENRPELTHAARLLEDVLLTRTHTADADYNDRALRFYQRLMQFSSPLMAKGVEDTLLYTYNAFIGHNEVGDGPERHGMLPEEFHRAMQHRQQYWPLAMNTTTTHDTKRGEDVRARLNVLTDLADEWLTEARAWLDLLAEENPSRETHVGVPDANDAYFMLQNMVGAYPMPGEPDDDFENRFRLYMEKALQEAKRHTTGWQVEETYHEGIRRFITRLFDQEGPFWARFEPFYRRVADFGVVNSLVQTALKCTCPGVPDVYQGAEGWDLSLVDPDNRRPVDFARRQVFIDALTAQPVSDWADLWQHRFDSRIKLALVRSLLHLRRAKPTLFAEGDYVPLTIEGRCKNHMLAFARRYETDWCIVVIPLQAARLCQQQNATDVLSLDWSDTVVLLPDDAPTSFSNVLTGEMITANRLAVQPLFQQLPVAVLLA
ncbi:malto-oligosyltrehalose synthase [Spirosoma montaniterrae]|uniref:Malto-oligosyltrehalose synthase n=1 Tax=Spirosoma montaniterrae TaxID=1178516 RepID=A0A1P9X010_9BACT|nr:malto-oligosyltrehalose synthase [Spirosoma montaniterrae]AQG80959.1 malto-oligosyltrehalose synthase [Spirosoma montaniterrae]